MCNPFRGTVDGRNPAPARAYLTIHYNLYPRTPFSMLCSEALCAGAGFQSFNFFVLGPFFNSNVKWGARGSRLQVHLVVQDFFHQPYV